MRGQNLEPQRILVTGGCGYVGSRLVPLLLQRGYQVRVLDFLLFGNRLPAECLESASFELIEGDIRDAALLSRALADVDAVIHLAAIANDPSAELDPAVTKAINLDAVLTLVNVAEQMGVRRLVNASSATVYGVRSEPDVTEDLSHEPISLYGKYKSETDRLIASRATASFETVSLRSATVCGWSPRMRLDLTVNLLTAAAVGNGRIVVHGGTQIRPNISIHDLAHAYVTALEAPAEIVNGQAYNVGGENASVMAIAESVCRVLDQDVQIVVEPVIDARSYRLCCDLAESELGFRAAAAVDGAIKEVADAFAQGRIPEPGAPIYRNLAQMQLVSVR